MLIQELLDFLFGSSTHPLQPAMADWIRDSRRFASFVEANGSKIRKKIHSRSDPGSLLDLRLELETAFRLHREPAFTLTYEPGTSGKRAGPDFGVSYTTRFEFMVEVTRIQGGTRPESSSDSDPASNSVSIAIEAEAAGGFSLENRIAEVVCSKLRQLRPGMANVLLVGANSAGLTADPLRLSILKAQQWAERNDPAILSRHGFETRAGFFACYQRLSELVVRDLLAAPGSIPLVWINPQGRNPMPAKVRTALYRSQQS